MRVCIHCVSGPSSSPYPVNNHFLVPPPCPRSEVEQWREEVRNSPEVMLAVQAFTAVNSNNFVRFFKLVKGASYLASCLLHRYFNQVRGRFPFILENRLITTCQKSSTSSFPTARGGA